MKKCYQCCQETDNSAILWQGDEHVICDTCIAKMEAKHPVTITFVDPKTLVSKKTKEIVDKPTTGKQYQPVYSGFKQNRLLPKAHYTSDYSPVDDDPHNPYYRPYSDSFAKKKEWKEDL